ASGKRCRTLAARADRRRRRHSIAVDRTRGASRCVRRHRRGSGCASARNRVGAHRVSSAMPPPTPPGRLSLLKAPYVVARRDFVAILLSRAFLFFLLGPLFPVAVFALAGSIGQRVDSTTADPQLGVAMESAAVDAILEAQERLKDQLGRAIPEVTVL